MVSYKGHGSVIHPHTELRFINDAVGYGIIATADIPMGTITWAVDPLDRVFSSESVATLSPLFCDLLDKYTYRDRNGDYVLCWDHGKYVNHSFRANCLSTPFDFEIAIRDIRRGEELTDDYGCFNVTAPFRGTDEGTRRKTVYPDDLLRYHRAWDAALERPFRRIFAVDQPLLPVVPAKTLDRVHAVINGSESMPSMRTCHYSEGPSPGMSRSLLHRTRDGVPLPVE